MKFKDLKVGQMFVTGNRGSGQFRVYEKKSASTAYEIFWSSVADDLVRDGAGNFVLPIAKNERVWLLA